ERGAPSRSAANRSFHGGYSAASLVDRPTHRRDPDPDRRHHDVGLSAPRARASLAKAAPGHGCVLSGTALAHHRPESPGVGRRAPQASHLHGPGGRPPQSPAGRLLAYPVLERLLLHARSAQPRDHPNVCAGHRRGLAGSGGLLLGLTGLALGIALL